MSSLCRLYVVSMSSLCRPYIKPTRSGSGAAAVMMDRRSDSPPFMAKAPLRRSRHICERARYAQSRLGAPRWAPRWAPHTNRNVSSQRKKKNQNKTGKNPSYWSGIWCVLRQAWWPGCNNSAGYCLNFKWTLQETIAVKLRVSNPKDGTFPVWFNIIFLLFFYRTRLFSFWRSIKSCIRV